jgi:hypothetical protein
LSAVRRRRASGVGQVKYGVVGDAGGQLGDVGDVVTVTTQASDDQRIDALVGQKLHATDLLSG